MVLQHFHNHIYECVMTYSMIVRFGHRQWLPPWEPMFIKQIREMKMTPSQTARTGIHCLGSRNVKYTGSPPSRDHA